MKTARRIAVVLLVLLGALAGCVAILSDERPGGQAGAEAEALAREIQRAAHVDAWERTRAVTWTFRGVNTHLWDRDRMLDRVRWGDVEVLVDLSKADGRAWDKGQPVEGRRRARLVERAYKAWINDSFWLNPLAKLYDEGVERRRVLMEGAPALLVEYTAGGVTPGDAYLWIPGEGGLPTAWRMWVSIIPIGGLEASWERWITLSTGAKVSTLHKVGPAKVELTGVEGAESLEALVPGADPFAALMGSAE